MFGAPGTGVHSYRFAGVAIVDVILTLFCAVVIAWYWSLPIVYVTIGAFATGIAAHRVFCVHTTIDTLLFNRI